MADRWVIDSDHPEGHLVAMTAAEQAQWDTDQAAGSAAVAALATADGNAATMTDRTVQALTNLETAAQNWGTLTQAQKDQAMKLTVQVVARLVRLMLRRLDTAI